MHFRKTIAMIALAGIPGLAQAAGWYGQVSIGQSKTSSDLVHNRESTIVRATDFQTDFDAKDNAWKIGAGYRFYDFLAVEVNYADLGKHSMVTTMLAGDAPAFAAIAIDREITGFGADLVLSAPVAERFTVYGRVGAFRSKLKAEAALSGNIVFTNGDPTETARSTTHNETVLRYGIGASWELWRNGSLHVEWERYNKVGKAFAIGGSGTTGEADTDAYWFGVTQRF
jgi:opacity protein-like surface antigen